MLYLSYSINIISVNLYHSQNFYIVTLSQDPKPTIPLCDRRSYSDWRSITSVIPWGSGQRPLLSVIYINDLNKNVHGLIRRFADNIHIGRIADREEDCQRIQQASLPTCDLSLCACNAAASKIVIVSVPHCTFAYGNKY